MENLNLTPQSQSMAVNENQSIFNQLFAIHPQLKQFRVRQHDKRFVIRAKYQNRSLFATRKTLEETILLFVLEFQRKVLSIN